MGLHIAQKKRLENISEYIIHIYKTEDLIRSYDFDIDQIEKYVIAHLPLTDDKKLNTRKWYVKLIEEMKVEKIEQAGHLASVQQVVNKLAVLHGKLLEQDRQYKKLFHEAQHDLEYFRKLASNSVDDIQICLNAVYGLLILRLQDRPVSNEQKKSVEVFGALLSYLSYAYRQIEITGQN